jgi:hypothetical protein
MTGAMDWAVFLFLCGVGGTALMLGARMAWNGRDRLARIDAAITDVSSAVKNLGLDLKLTLGGQIDQTRHSLRQEFDDKFKELNKNLAGLDKKMDDHSLADATSFRLLSERVALIEGKLTHERIGNGRN